MNGDRIAELLFYGIALTLPISALLARRLPLKQVLGMAALWFAIIVGALVAVNVTRRGVAASWAQAKALLGDDEQRVSGATVRLRMAADGHFWATVSINGVARRLLVDSGASTTALSMATATAAGLDLEESAFPAVLETANGPVTARVATIDRLKLGSIEARGLRVVVAPAFGEMDVLGMNFLSRLASWKVMGDELILEPKPDTDAHFT